jgi:hypothetical protein
MSMPRYQSIHVGRTYSSKSTPQSANLATEHETYTGVTRELVWVEQVVDKNPVAPWINKSQSMQEPDTRDAC